MKLLKIYNEPAPYMVDLHNYLTKYSSVNSDFEYAGLWLFSFSSQKWKCDKPSNFIGSGLSRSDSLLRRFAAWIRKIVPSINANDFIIIAGYSPFENFLSCIYCILSGKQFALHFDSWVTSKRMLGRFAKKFIFERATLLLPGGIRQREYVLGQKGIKEENVILAPLTVALERFPQVERSAIQKVRIICVGRLIPRKRFDIAIEAMRSINERFEEEIVEMLIVGDGPELLKLKKKAEGLENVHFTGFVEEDQIPKLMRDASILIHPASFEPWGLVVVEAMLSGLVTIATSSVGASDVIVNGETGFVTSEDNTQEIANILSELIKNKEKIISIGKKARASIISEWSLDKWDAVISRVISMVDSSK